MPSNERGSRKEKVGVVVSDKMAKTITVRVNWVAHHPVYDKITRRATKFKAHDEKSEAKVGDTVRIQETRPMSKTKRWRLVGIVKKASVRPEAVKSEEPVKTRE
jgi:small subunit ribosomal protein S17